MTQYGQYCPVTRALEVLGDRWTLLVVRELLLGATRFNEIARGLPGMSRGLLSKRLAQLEKAGVVEHRATERLEGTELSGGYHPTRACEDLRPIVFGLAEWGAQWAFGEPRADELDPTVLMWWIRGGLDPAPFGGRRTVLHVVLPDAHRCRFWLLVEPHDVSLCFTDPGYDVDVTLTSPIGVLYQIWEGVLELATVTREGTVTLTGSRSAILALPLALRLSPIAPIVRRARARQAVLA